MGISAKEIRELEENVRSSNMTEEELLRYKGVITDLVVSNEEPLPGETIQMIRKAEKELKKRTKEEEWIQEDPDDMGDWYRCPRCGHQWCTTHVWDEEFSSWGFCPVCGGRIRFAAGDRIEVHELKCLPEYYEAALLGKKSFELRKDDRKFKVGDLVLLREYDNGYYTGRTLGYRTIVYILRNCEEHGLKEGYCIIGF